MKKLKHLMSQRLPAGHICGKMVPFSNLAISLGGLQILTSCVLLHPFALVLIGEKRMKFQFCFLQQYQRGNSRVTEESSYSLKVLLTFIWY